MVWRTLTSVWKSNGTYTSTVEMPSGIDIRVEPSTLRFSKLNSKQKFKMTFTVLGGTSGKVYIWEPDLGRWETFM